LITLDEIKRIGKGEIIVLSGSEALLAVKQKGYALQYVKEQTPEICMEAVKENGYALQYVKEQTPEICMEAVKENGYALQYVDPSVFPDKNVAEATYEELIKMGWTPPNN
jgi:hypothetical protein